jgi:protein TonB
MIRRVLPWLASAALHAAVGAAAFLTVAGIAGGGPTPNPDATYTVAIRPGGGPQIQDPLPADERSYGVPQDTVTIDDTPAAEVPEMPASSSKLQASGPRVRVGSAEPEAGFRTGTNTKFNTAEGNGGGSPTLGKESGKGVGAGRDEGVEAIPVETPSPTYPDSARRANLQGIVIAEIQIDTAGRVESAKAAEGSGSRVLDDAAIAAVKSWRYRPATLNGKPVPSVRRVRFVFRLE